MNHTAFILLMVLVSVCALSSVFTFALLIMATRMKAAKITVCKYCECIMKIEGDQNAIVADVIDTAICDECAQRIN